MQLRAEFFSKICQQTVARRLGKLVEYDYLERRVIQNGLGKDISVYLTTPKALTEVRPRYPHRITSDLCKSDSIDHDIKLVSLRRRLEAIGCVTSYLTENVLQACGEFADSERLEPFVRNHTDAALEFEKGGHKILAGLEFENSLKNIDRYARKLSAYYADPRVPIVFYIYEAEGIKKAVARAESGLVGLNRPRCFYASSRDVLSSGGECTFTNLRGDKIVLR